MKKRETPSIFPKVNIYVPSYRLLDEPGPNGSYFEGKEVEAEVLTLHLSTWKMRVRYFNSSKNQYESLDIPIEEFFKHYKIVPVEKV